MKQTCIPALLNVGISSEDADALRRISMTLQRWFELECGDGNNHGSWAIVRGNKVLHDASHGRERLPREKWEFVHDDDGAPYIERHHYLHGRGKDYVTHTRINDREAGAKRRLAAIMARYPTLGFYIQGDPRGCALYILRPGDIPEGATVDSCYSRGIAVYK